MQNVILAQQILAVLPLITTGVNELVAWIKTVRTTAQQTGEWTAAAEAAYKESLLASAQDPANKPD